MADHDTSPPSTTQLDWQQKFQAALLEGDSKKLPPLVEAAEAAIYLRLQSLVDSPDGHVERNALTDAIRTLRAIQTGKLHYPDWNGQ
jgi:hypothetical protein